MRKTVLVVALAVGLAVTPSMASARTLPPSVDMCGPGFIVTTIAGSVSCQPEPVVVVPPAPVPPVVVVETPAPAPQPAPAPEPAPEPEPQPQPAPAPEPAPAPQQPAPVTETPAPAPVITPGCIYYQQGWMCFGARPSTHINIAV